MDTRTFFLILFLCIAVNHSFAQRGKFVQNAIENKLDRDATPNKGPIPDYADLFYWAASPHKRDMSDSIPIGVKDEVRTQDADMFFIHPTTYIGTDENILNEDFNRMEWLDELSSLAWNADLTDSTINNRTDTRTILNQATAFNGNCRIFAPRYRQANIKAFIIPESASSQEAFELAYDDIKNAFEYYLNHENNGRPVIIASHSQGTLHAIRLLQEFFDEKPLQSLLVCAYLIGHHIPVDVFKHIPMSVTPDAVGGFVGWRSYQKGEITPNIKLENGNSLCINPLTWSDSTKEASVNPSSGMLFNSIIIKSEQLKAQIEPSSKILWVTLPSMKNTSMKRAKNLHIFDYNLFWMDIRNNVKVRIGAFRNKI